MIQARCYFDRAAAEAKISVHVPRRSPLARLV
jgi:hypothetical protein